MDTVVICVYKTGGEYTKEYVYRLYNSCIKHGATNFSCLSDDPDVSEICHWIPLYHNLPGWWSKLEMFSMYPYKNVQYLYIDLDTVIKGSLKPIMEYEHTFTVLQDFYNIYKRPELKDQKKIASGMVAWSGDYIHLLDSYIDSCPEEYTMKNGKNGDQAFIEDNIGDSKVEFFQDLFPNIISSRKWSSKEEKDISSIVCFHGKPRPHQCGWSIY